MPHDTTFFDIHMHAMDMSHPNLLAFIDRVHCVGGKLVAAGLAEPFMSDKERQAYNLLSVMENSIEDFFCLMEFFLKYKKVDDTDANPLVVDGVFEAAGRRFQTILLTPLIMDFGQKNKTEGDDSKYFYDVTTGKPVVEQSADVLRAIAKYCKFEARPKNGDPGEVEIIPRDAASSRLFEIYPFLGINTQNYDFEKEIKPLIHRCFGGYTGRRQDLLKNMGTFSGLEDEAEDFRDAIHDVGSNMFAGIKVYPPLGFDPWPIANEDEMEKVNFLYDFCERKQIPITAHCSDGGFATVDDAQERTNPAKWELVLNRYPKLTLNLAHLGNQKNYLGIIHRHEWRNKVIELTKKHPNVYTDISCLAFDDGFYSDLVDILYDHHDSPGLINKILFGSDFMINLMWTGSYNQYLRAFVQTSKLSDAQKPMLCNANPARFMFGGALD